MTAFQIKVLAVTAMVIDHIGLFFFPDILWFRVIGRLAFPLFAYLIANGVIHTKNISGYLKRLLLFAMITQIPFYLACRLVNSTFWNLNILFTFFLALAAIAIIQKNRLSIFLTLTITLTFSVLGHFLKVEYGAYGVIAVILFYHYFSNLKMLFFTQIVLAIFAAVVPAISNAQILIAEISLGPLIALSALPIIFFYDGHEGSKTKYLFYVFYPLQFVIFYLVKIFI